MLGPPSPAGWNLVNGVWSYLNQTDTGASSLILPDPINHLAWNYALTIDLFQQTPGPRNVCSVSEHVDDCWCAGVTESLQLTLQSPAVADCTRLGCSAVTAVSKVAACILYGTNIEWTAGGPRCPGAQLTLPPPPLSTSPGPGQWEKNCRQIFPPFLYFFNVRSHSQAHSNNDLHCYTHS